MTLMEGFAPGGRAEPVTPSSPRPSHTRSQSISSDHPSSTGFSGFQSPIFMASPDPMYIAASAASQIVTNDQDARTDAWFDQNGIEPSGETALVAPGALKLVNAFLDQLLFNFLTIARSTSLSSLRPAVTEVLKPKLAKSAIHTADAELQEYLGGGDDEELLDAQNGAAQNGDLDLELLWKRTRLRCMVYSSLGDMEEDEEDHWTAREQLDGLSEFGHRRSESRSVVSPAVAIFLTCILEFMGEQSLIVAGQAAYQRLRAKHDKEIRDGANSSSLIAERMVVDEQDMERVALDRTLGRLWRGWKKRIRPSATGASMSRSFSRESLPSRGNSRSGSSGNEGHIPTIDQVDRKPSITEMPESELLDHERQPPEREPPEYERAAAIPLPMYDNDVREIEIPCLANQSDDEGEPEPETFTRRPRPKSLVICRDIRVPLSPNISGPNSPLLSPTTRSTRRRSRSLPSPAATPSLSSGKTYKGSQVENARSAVLASMPTVEMEVGINSELLGDEVMATLKPENDTESSEAVINKISVESVAALGAAPTYNEGSQADVTDITDIEDLEDEEPQVMTSSRISLDRTAPPERPQTETSSVGSRSVHSVKLVDVASPRSPTRSQNDFVGSIDRITPNGSLSLSRSDCTHSPNTRVAQEFEDAMKSIKRNDSFGSAKNNTRDSVSDYGEDEAEAAESPSEVATPRALAIPERSFSEALVPVSSELSPTSEKPNMSANTPLFGELEPAYVLDDAPVTLPHRSIAQPPHTIPHVGVTSHSKVLESSIPPLTPLREMMEVAPDTSDEASSIAPSDVQSDTIGLPSIVPGLSKRSIETQRGVPRPLNIRTSPSQRQPEEVVTPRQEKGQRPRTSGSSTSSKSHKLRRIPTLEDPIQEDKSKSFEQLLHNNQTLQYTLTPQTMREIESPDSPRLALLDGAQSPHTGQSAGKSSGANSILVSKSAPVPTPKPAVIAPVVSVQQQAVSPASRVRSNAPQARDARVDRSSIGDFANFIRSTGPSGVSLNQLPKSAPKEVGQRGRNSIMPSGSTSKFGPTPPSRHSDSSNGRVKLQARDAAARRDNTSDLIDFIRQGPPNANPRENPRIPRSVAPFRSTMDSDQMSGAIGTRSADLSPTDGRFSQVSNDQSMQSVNSSMNSQSALLNSHKPLQSHAPYEGAMPKRKTRRVRDPYAIDFSDEEDEDDIKGPFESKREQESIVEFLRSVPPPPTSSVFDEVAKPVGKKSSHSTLISRFGRASTPQSTKSSVSSKPVTRPKNDMPQIPSLDVSASKSKYAVGGQPNSTYRTTPTNYVSRLDTQRKPVATSNNGHLLQKSLEPRDAKNGPISGSTVELADFLKNTAPPPGNGPRSIAFGSTGGKENGPGNGGFSRMFVRRKKIAA